MNIKLVRLGVAACISAVFLAIGASAVNLPVVKSYTDGVFSDVEPSAWYASDVINAYELGLMTGDEKGYFNPNDNVTVAQAITLAARISASVSEESIPEIPGAWYEKYLQYLISKGTIDKDSFDNLNRPVLRFEVAKLFADVLPDDFLEIINNISIIPDVSENAEYYDELLCLYKAGIVSGRDSSGNFYPDENITRAEISAILSRVSNSDMRLKDTCDRVSNDDAYSLILTGNFNGAKEGISSGWELDNRGGYPRTSIEGGYAILTDISSEEGTAVIREFNTVTTGKVKLDFKFMVSGESDGVYFEFQNDKGESVYRVQSKDGVWTLCGNGKDVAEFGKVIHDALSIRIILDIDNAKGSLRIGEDDYGTYPLTVDKESLNLQNFRIGTTKESLAALSLFYVRADVNYALNEDFTYSDLNELPFDWKGEKARINGVGARLNMDAGANAHYDFSPLSGVVVGEAAFFIPSQQKLSYSLNSTGRAIVEITTDGKSIVADGKSIYEYSQNMWYRLRVEADTDTDTYVVKLNGRVIAKDVPFVNNTDSIDSVAVANTGEIDGLDFDDFKVFRLVTHDDYVPKPVKCTDEEDYTIGINVCSLWRNGIHNGWSCITPFDEFALGYYDEGIPETADWEIKYMVEHGIDFQAFCWFADYSNAPLKNPTNSAHLHDGYMNAKYADDMKYCLIWEAVNGQIPQNLAVWKTHYVPYLIENYFKDSRYMTIDNRPLFFVFGAEKLAAANSLGHASVVKEAMEYLREQVKMLGFDDMILLTCGEVSTIHPSMGFDGNYAYSWGREGYKFETNKDGILNSSQFIYSVPTVSVGFNDVAWYGNRSPLMTVDTYRKTHEWVRDEYLPEYAQKGTWQENFLMLSTWNEYGEGTYLMPSKENGGFGYLDVVRETYTSDKANEEVNVYPTENQRKRINRLYPQAKTLLRRSRYLQTATGEDAYEVEASFSYAKQEIVSDGINSPKQDSNGFSGVTANHDGKIMIKLHGGISLDRAKVVHIRAQIPVGEALEVYYTTVDDNNASADKCQRIISTTGEMTDYWFDFSKDIKWKGTLAAYLRVDPSHKAGVEFAFESLEFLIPPETAPKAIVINDEKTGLDVPYEYGKYGEMLVPFDPALAVDYKLGAYHTWDSENKALTLRTNGHTVTYTVGKAEYVLDGVVKTLEHEITQSDGLPLIPIESFCKDVGFTCYSNFEGAAVINTHQKVLLDKIAEETKNRKPNEWNFDTDGDSEMWNSSNMALAVSDGYLSAISATASNDPSIILGKNLNLEAKRYTKLEYRVRYNYTAAAPSKIHMYFTTTTDGVYNENKALYVPLNSTSSNGEWEICSFDLSQYSSWQGTINHLRLDPFNANGSMDIDYIRFVEDPDYVDISQLPTQVYGGDAENINNNSLPFFSENSNISVVADPENSENSCYRVLSRGGKSWVYTRQRVYYRPGTTYKVEFDVKIAALDNDLNPEDFTAPIICNLRYKDSKGGTDHIIGSIRVSVSDGWVHYSGVHTIDANSEDRAFDQLAIYSDPVDNLGVGYYLDNITITKVD